MGWLSKYQDGGVLPDKERITAERAEKGRERALEYYSSPGYLNLLKKNYDNPQEEQRIRIDNVSKAKVNLNQKFTKWNRDNSIDLKPYFYKDASEHEFLHAGTEGPKRISDREKQTILMNVSDPHRESYMAIGEEPYIEIPEEYQARLGVARMLMKENGLYDYNEGEFTQKHLDAIKKDMKKQPKRWNINGFQDVMNSKESDSSLIEVMNNVAELKTKNNSNNWLAKYGKVIEDDRGQWAHPGKVTKINSNDITMKGVTYPVLGVSNTGDEQMMMPGEDYKFNGDSVTEYPMTNNSGWLDNY